jgi:hypothetical protein
MWKNLGFEAQSMFNYRYVRMTPVEIGRDHFFNTPTSLFPPVPLVVQTLSNAPAGACLSTHRTISTLSSRALRSRILWGPPHLVRT